MMIMMIVMMMTMMMMLTLFLQYMNFTIENCIIFCTNLWI
jgi:hypothetical protein